MANCPLIQNKCSEKECQWWVPTVGKCAVMIMGILIERIYDMGALTYNKFLGSCTEADDEQNYVSE
jgi:hypothetical protein